VANEILTEQTTTVRVVAFKDSRGKAVKVDGTPKWATDNSDLLTLVQSDDGMSCKVTSGIIGGTAKVQVLADADLTEGVRDLVGVVEFTVKQGEAVNVELQVDTPTDI
jgi:hypothetical protein